MKFATKVGLSLTAAFLAVSGCTYTISPRVTERDAALKIVRGALVDAHVEDGVKMDALLPHVSYIRLPKFLQTTEVQASEKDAVTIRTKENARIYGNFKIKFTLDNSDKNFPNVYTELKVDEIEDLFPHIMDYTIPAAIEVYKDVPTNAVNDDLPGVGKRVAEKLQGYLNERGYTYIRIHDVVPSGVGLSQKANNDLEAIVSEERKLELLKVQGQVADRSLDITKKQSAVTVEALDALRKAGVNDSQLIQAYYLQLMRDTDKVGTPFVPGPIPGTGVGAVPVESPARRAPAQAPAATPN
jgi:hypothetical protein